MRARSGRSELRGVELEPEQRAAGQLPGRRRRPACAGSPRGRRGSGARAGRSRRSRCRRPSDQAASTAAAAASTAWVAASRSPARSSTGIVAARRAPPPRRARPRRRAAPARPARAASARAIAGLGRRLARRACGCSASGSSTPASSPTSSSAPRAIPSADRGDRRGEQPERRERVERAGLARRAGEQRGRARRRDRDARRRPISWLPVARSPETDQVSITSTSAAANSARRMSGRPDSSIRASPPSWTTQPPISQSQCSTLLAKRQRPEIESSSSFASARPEGAKTPPTTVAAPP